MPDQLDLWDLLPPRQRRAWVRQRVRLSLQDFWTRQAARNRARRDRNDELRRKTGDLPAGMVVRRGAHA